MLPHPSLLVAFTILKKLLQIFLGPPRHFILVANPVNNDGRAILKEVQLRLGRPVTI
jgi:hypothetical protein